MRIRLNKSSNLEIPQKETTNELKILSYSVGQTSSTHFKIQFLKTQATGVWVRDLNGNASRLSKLLFRQLEKCYFKICA